MLTLGVVAIAGVLLAVVALLAGAQGARGRAQAGADLAALAAAQHLLDHGGLDPGGLDPGGLDPGGLDPGGLDAGGAGGAGGAGVAEACEVAEAAARRNDVRLSSCRGDGRGVVVVSTVRPSVAGAATAHARAGPVSTRG